MLCVPATADTSGASLSETQQQLFKRCHLVYPNISHSWPSAHSHPSCEALLGCLDESVIIIAFIPINFFMLQGSVSHSTPQPTLYMCACLRLELGIQQQERRRKKPGRSVWSTISIQGWSANFPTLLLWTEQYFLKQVVLSRWKTSRETEDHTK